MDEMKNIGVKFHYWQENSNWNSTPLMGEDKLIVLKNFDLNPIFPEERANLIRNLWNNFYELYENLKNSNISGDIFKQKAKTWLQLFLTPSIGQYNTHTFKKGFYRPADVTPYIHVLVFHVPEFLNEHHRFGIAAFSCSGVEKKTISTDIKNDQNQEFIVEKIGRINEPIGLTSKNDPGGTF
ncbi:hypothetical protein C2G38_2036209 [Gigaspora rosea]|uniref:Uncharacterized protein n=1 Tax=Gigaspora rosea TaxID=44941 RepID=A0A397VH63_9GLOM|nr:hypothetical protein C2G38_2036209 [Gigaspora rosea]